MQNSVRTVTGDISPASLGMTFGHEHLFTCPAPRLQDGGDMVLDDEDKSVAELELYRRASGGALIELTTPEFGRDPLALRRISERSGVHVVATTGHASADYWRDVLDLDGMREDDLVAEMVRDLTVGIDGTPVRAGIIKAGTSHNAVLPAEERVIRAAARAQRETGAPITTHTTAGTMASEQARIFLSAGADPRRVCLGHLDRHLDFDTHRDLAEQGFFLGYDCISKDWYEPDARRVEHIARLFEAGLGAHICLSGDLARRSQLVAWGGGPGYTYIPWRFVPWLRRVGLGDAELRMLLVDNPARLLTWGPC
ncbi:phosphotriesterase [Streptomyces sp. NPDC093250]|uniref:phosphotriesterase family protein n=1 Tax=Streptomyces sp. NPDC093250 TaxID=3366036 RepID=UPI00382DC3A6